jgi:hypothetical protein
VCITGPRAKYCLRFCRQPPNRNAGQNHYDDVPRASPTVPLEPVQCSHKNRVPCGNPARAEIDATESFTKRTPSIKQQERQVEHGRRWMLRGLGWYVRKARLRESQYSRRSPLLSVSLKKLATERQDKIMFHIILGSRRQFFSDYHIPSTVTHTIDPNQHIGQFGLASSKGMLHRVGSLIWLQRWKFGQRCVASGNR